MGNHYMVRPLGIWPVDWQNAVFDPACPPVDEPGRYPSFVELRQVLESFEEYDIAHLSGAFSHDFILHPAGMTFAPGQPRLYVAWLEVEEAEDEFHPTRLGFSGGSPEVMVRILERLAQRCGTQILLPDTGWPAIVVTPGMDIAAVIAAWNARLG